MAHTGSPAHSRNRSSAVQEPDEHHIRRLRVPQGTKGRKHPRSSESKLRHLRRFGAIEDTAHVFRSCHGDRAGEGTDYAPIHRSIADLAPAARKDGGCTSGALIHAGVMRNPWSMLKDARHDWEHSTSYHANLPTLIGEAIRLLQAKFEPRSAQPPKKRTASPR